MTKFKIRPYDDYEAWILLKLLKKQEIKEVNLLCLSLVELLQLLMKMKMKLNDIDYEDIYDNINDYEYPYNYINRSDLV